MVERDTDTQDFVNLVISGLVLAIAGLIFLFPVIGCTPRPKTCEPGIAFCSDAGVPYTCSSTGIAWENSGLPLTGCGAIGGACWSNGRIAGCVVADAGVGAQ